MIQIISEGYENIAPQQPSKKALAVFNMKDARIAFNYGNCDFVVALDEKSMKFTYCYSLLECEHFWEQNNRDELHIPTAISRFIEKVAEENKLDVQDVMICYDRRGGRLEAIKRCQPPIVLGTFNVDNL